MIKYPGRKTRNYAFFPVAEEIHRRQPFVAQNHFRNAFQTARFGVDRQQFDFAAFERNGHVVVKRVAAQIRRDPVQFQLAFLRTTHVKTRRYHHDNNREPLRIRSIRSRTHELAGGNAPDLQNVSRVYRGDRLVRGFDKREMYYARSVRFEDFRFVLRQLQQDTLKTAFDRPFYNAISVFTVKSLVWETL